jgi:ribosomal protein S14
MSQHGEFPTPKRYRKCQGCGTAKADVRYDRHTSRDLCRDCFASVSPGPGPADGMEVVMIATQRARKGGKGS